MENRSFPLSAAEITPSWLTEILRANGTLARSDAVERFEVRPIGLGFGQTGESSRLALHYAAPLRAANAPASVFVKFPTNDAARRKAAASIGLYEREINCYKNLLSRIAVKAPACHFGEIAPGGELFALVLEDFPTYRAGDETVGLTVEEACLAIDLMTQVHGPYWGRMQEVDLPPLGLPGRDRYGAAWDLMDEHFGDVVPKEFALIREDYLAALETLKRWLYAEPCTLGHGDLRLDNLLFDLGGRDPIVAVDWQAARPSKGIRDFEYLVSHSMEIEDRRAHERALLARYVENINAFGLDYSLRQAEEDYRRAMLFDFCTVLHIVGIHFNTHERAIRRKRGLLRRATTAMLDWGALDLLPEFK
ncbi:phosphotransferase [Chelatococcus reniformis]|uniref:Aminoglycoside phosphotransferase n=1 Tax=Chelatococcus reniformis TaxID=1494448 RepID=A0A916UA70_9HYPH|nr:phosphotransferase [Chelatococcus reniformis]GGC65550.1 aminoglycoside phosphotransferase [Chelatococcus reniformis]